MARNAPDEMPPVPQPMDTVQDDLAAGIADRAVAQLAHRQETVPHILVEDENLEKLTHFYNKAEPRDHAKLDWLLELANSAGRVDDIVTIPDEEGNPVVQVVDCEMCQTIGTIKGNGGVMECPWCEGEGHIPQRRGFVYPDFKENLVKHDHQYRTSIKGKTRAILENITKVVHGPEARRSFWGR